MNLETQLFWAVLVGLLVLDNLVLLPAGSDYLRLGRRGKLTYEPASRLRVLERDLIFLNPLNPFDRIVKTKRSIGYVSAADLKAARSRVRGALPHSVGLSTIGTCYLITLAAFACMSYWIYFGYVLVMLLLVHVLAWLAAFTLLLRNFRSLDLRRGQVISLSIEAFLVPGYLVNIGKRVCLGQVLEVPALTLGLRQIRTMKPDPERELYIAQIARRIDELAIDFDVELGSDFIATLSGNGNSSGASVNDFSVHNPASPRSGGSAQHQTTLDWFKDARECLTVSARRAG